MQAAQRANATIDVVRRRQAEEGKFIGAIGHQHDLIDHEPQPLDDALDERQTSGIDQGLVLTQAGALAAR